MAAYRIDVRKSDQGFSVSCPDLPGCWSQGSSEAEAVTNIRLAIQEYIDAAEEVGLA
jgi:predicted RNase H-like HicB family nuclease